MTISILSSQDVLDDIADGKDACTMVDARTADEFEAEHIAGAISIAWESWCDLPPANCQPILSEPGFWGLLADPVRHGFHKRLSAAGIRHDSPIVVYGDGARSAGREGRVAWMLIYLGASQVYLLDGGWTSWLGWRGPIECGDLSFRSQPAGWESPRPFQLSPQEKRRARIGYLGEMYRTGRMPLMIDVRTPAEFHGDSFDYQPRKGRLPRSVLFPFAALFEPDGRYVGRERYLELLPPEIFDEDSIVAYCEVGVRAATFALLHEIYTGQVLPVFDGSIMEWASHVNLPVLV